jgi:hypothetical protein
VVVLLTSSSPKSTVVHQESECSNLARLIILSSKQEATNIKNPYMEIIDSYPTTKHLAQRPKTVKRQNICADFSFL